MVNRIPGGTFIVLLTTTILFLYIPASLVQARLTEFRTERVPVLVHKLRTANLNLNTLSERAELGPRSGFRLKTGDIHKTNKGGKRVRLVQTYAKYEVYGPTVAAELNTRGYYTGQMYGEVARDLRKDIPKPESCIRDVKTLLNRVIRLEKLHNDQGNIDKRDGRRIILADPAKSKAKIVYVVEFFYAGNSYVSIPVYYIDACSNSILFHYDKVKNVTLPQSNSKRQVENPKQQKSSFLRFQSERKGVGSACLPAAAGEGGNGNTGKVTYNDGEHCLPVTESGGTCTMETTFVKVVDNEGSTSESKKTAITFNCLTGFVDPVNGAFGVANDALYHGEYSALFFKETFGITPLKKKPRLVVHYGKNYGNAFWTGEDMFFGDGNDEYYPFVGLGLVAHELAHGFTVGASDLIYMFQMGGIDEAFSDMTAVATVNFATSATDWEIGADIVKSGKPFRYMNDPPKDGRSIKSIWRYHPLMNVHYSSGVFNYAFYKLITAQSVPLFEGYEDFMVANRDIWGRFTRFRKGACGVMQASYDNGHSYGKIKKAFKYTGIGLRFCNHDALKATLFPGETRTNILVKSERSPIFEVDMRTWRGVSARAKAEDSSPVQILVSADPHVQDIIGKGLNVVKFPANHTLLYVQLKSDHVKDVQVTLQVAQEK